LTSSGRKRGFFERWRRRRQEQSRRVAERAFGGLRPPAVATGPDDWRRDDDAPEAERAA
jgi:hypothetical protein